MKLTLLLVMGLVGLTSAQSSSATTTSPVSATTSSATTASTATGSDASTASASTTQAAGSDSTTPTGSTPAPTTPAPKKKKIYGKPREYSSTYAKPKKVKVSQPKYGNQQVQSNPWAPWGVQQNPWAANPWGVQQGGFIVNPAFGQQVQGGAVLGQLPGGGLLGQLPEGGVWSAGSLGQQGVSLNPQGWLGQGVWLGQGPQIGSWVQAGAGGYGQQPQVQAGGYGQPQVSQGSYGKQPAVSSKIPKYGGDSGVKAGGKVEGCYLQLNTGQWVWNSLKVVKQCGGFICLNTNPKRLHWTVRPDLVPHVPMQLCQSQPEPQSQPIPVAPVGGSETGLGDLPVPDTPIEPAVPEEPEYPVVDEIPVADNCQCSEWEYPGDCSADGQQFRWRSCSPRYCDVEDEYTPCEPSDVVRSSEE